MANLQRLKRLQRHLAYQIHRGTLPLRRRGFSTFNEEQLINSYIEEMCRKAPLGVWLTSGGDGRPDRTVGVAKEWLDGTLYRGW